MGNMGLPMAGNLVKNGFQVKGFDFSEEQRTKSKAMGITPSDSMQDTVKGVDYVITALPRGNDVEKVCLGPDGIFATADKGTHICDVSTISPNLSRQLAN